ncbi:MAG: MBG domain-containing protein, partial [Desulfurivibrionaceae bacterium]
NREYGEVNPALTATYSGFKLEDNASVVSGLNLSTAATQGSNIGDYAITAASGTATNYTITHADGALTITPAPLTITADAKNREFGEVNPALTATYSGFKLEDNASVVSGLNLSTAATQGSNVGDYTITAANGTATNYTITHADGALTITPAPLTITADAKNREFGEVNPALTATYSGFKLEDNASVVRGLNLSTAATQSSSVGSHQITAAEATATNYIITHNNGSLTITPAPLAITANDASREYGEANPAFTATYSGFKLEDNASVVSGLNLSTAATQGSNVGSHQITAADATATNYSISYNNGSLTISPAPLTITANDASREYGEANPAFTASYRGFKLEDDASVVSGLILSTLATQGSNIGNYTITAVDGTATNYFITRNNGVLTITPAPLTVTADDKNRLVGEANPALTASYTGFKLTDGASVVHNLVLATSAEQSSNAGMYGITAHGGTAANYILSFVDGVLTVTAAPVPLPDPEPEVLANTPPMASFTAADREVWTVGTLYEDSRARQYIRDIPPPWEDKINGRVLPDPRSMELLEALSALTAGGYTPEDRAKFYSLLSEEYVVSSLKKTGHDPLAAFFAAAVTGGKGNEADLKTLIEGQDGLIHGLRVPMFGVFDRMRHLAMTDLLGGALDELRKNPDAADMLDDGMAGDKTKIAIRPRFETSDGLVKIDGRLEDISNMLHLRVNGRWVYVDDDGKFAVKLPVSAGEHAVKLEVSDQAGSRATTLVEVRSEADGTRNPAFMRKPEGRKVALLIAVEEYDSAIPELVTPVQDARAIGRQLEAGYGFETKLLANPTKAEVLAAMRGLAAELSEHDSLTVFYAGHGYLMEETGRGYWLPRDAETTNPKNWISNRDIARLFHRTRAKQIMMVSDSCYSGAFTKEGAVVENGGPARDLRAVMALSSGGEQPVWDGGGDGHSVFAAKMISALGSGEAAAGLKLYRAVRAEVVKASPQVPGYGAMISAGYDQGADYALR